MRHRILRTIVVRIGFTVGRLRGPRARVVLATSHTSALTGNLRFIAEELGATHPEIPIATLTLRRGGRLQSLAPLVSTFVAGYHLAASRVMVVDDYFFPMYVITPRRGTARIQVWHAAGAFKRFGFSVLDKTFGADEDLVRHVRIHSNYSLALVSSMSVAPHYAEAFGQPAEIFTSRIGIPRTDLFGDAGRRARAETRVRATYQLPTGKRVILYAPTFRGETVRHARYADLMDLELMHRVLGEDHVLLLKLHPFIRDAVQIPETLREFVIDASGDPDVNELMLVSDILVTDYSSVIYEFSLLGRPIAFLAPDDGAYDEERGFYFDFRRDAPGPIVDTTEELTALIRANLFDLDWVAAFRDASFDVPPGGAAARLVDRVILPALRGEEVTAASIEADLGSSAGG
jgi:CDP-glycerol glycerophosphotransferase (TagB/SpsB family)